MTDGEAFLLVFVLIYLSDCLAWLPPSGFAFISFWGKRFEVKRASVKFDAIRRGFVVLNPLPPFGTVYVGETWPLSLDETGIAPLSRENPNPGPLIGALPGTGFIAWEQIETIGTHDLDIEINGERFALAATKASAKRLAQQMEAIRCLPEVERSAAIAELVSRRFRHRDVARLHRFFRRVTDPMRFSASILFGVIFILVPYAYWRFSDDTRFFFVLGLSWLLMLQIAIDFVRLHRRFYPKLASERWQHFVLAILLPHYAIRSLDVLSRAFLARYHPLALGTSLLPPDEHARFAERIRRDSQTPIPLPPDLQSTEIAEAFRVSHFLPALEIALARGGTASAGEEAPSSGRRIEDALDTDSPALCPRCEIGYEEAGLPCPDCGDLLTVARPS